MISMPSLQRWLPLALTGLITACAASAAMQGTLDTGAPRVQAALANVVVENGTDRDLVIFFRGTGRSSGEVSVGRVAARTGARMAPIPAGEPISLGARDPNGRVFEVPPRTFALDEVWRWVIPANAAFR